jgi:hypothetical protein
MYTKIHCKFQYIQMLNKTSKMYLHVLQFKITTAASSIETWLLYHNFMKVVPNTEIQI